MPHYLGGAFVAYSFSIASHFVGWQLLMLMGPILYLVYKAYGLHVSRLHNQKKHAEDVSALHLRTIQALALAIEAKDQTTHSHLARVQVYARELGRELKLDEKEQNALMAASLLHDIGKLAVPEHIISKPGKLSPEEFEKMKIHPIVGAEILEQVQFPYPVVPIVRTHHERWDGKGYPAGIQGEDIPIGARILAVVDCLDALASDRQYRRALPLDEAMKKVEAEAGTAFDPQVVDVLKRRYVELEAMAKAEGSGLGSLSTEVKVDRGDAPGAGFESHGPRPGAMGTPVDYQAQIADARRDMHGLIEFSKALQDELTVDDTLSMLAGRLRRLVPHHCVAIWRRHDETLVPAFVLGDDARLFSSIEIPVGQGLSGWVAENHKPIVNGNPSVESGHLADRQKYSSLRSAIAVPLEGPKGVTGVLALYHADRDAFTREHLRLLQSISAKIAMSVEHAMLATPVKSDAPKHFVTGVVDSRELFVQLEQQLARARRENRPLSVTMLDIDHFQPISLRLGRYESEGFVRAFALGLKSVCRENDTVARMGSSEFAVILPGATAEEISGRVAQFREVLAGTYSDRLSRDLLTVSAGTSSSPADGDDASTLLSVADQRLYADRHARTIQSAARKRPAATLADTLLSQVIH
jgi:diguanylate cyclase (GGDEF)-like protein/putative nucleotidyltransferase with HDIG domain